VLLLRIAKIVSDHVFNFLRNERIEHLVKLRRSRDQVGIRFSHCVIPGDGAVICPIAWIADKALPAINSASDFA
jgi:hypothetical protein